MLAELAVAIQRRAADGGVKAQVAAIQRLTSAVAEQVAHSYPENLPATLENFSQMFGRLSPDLRPQLEEVLTTYGGQEYVSDAYARELSTMKTHAVDVERVTDDPPERITAWLATINDACLRDLDVQLLTDLLAIEADPRRWHELALAATHRASDLARVGQFEYAHQFIAPLAAAAADVDRPQIQPTARDALDQMALGPFVQLVAGALRTIDFAGFGLLTRLCHTIGPTVVPALVDALAVEQDPRTRRRLREVVIGFGALGRSSIEKLMSASRWEVRRTAATMLREFGSGESLRALEPLLNDADPSVQREALRTLLLVSDDRAPDMLMRALERGDRRTRDNVAAELGSLRDEGAGRLCAALLQHLSPRQFGSVYLAAINALGVTGSPEGVDALRAALYRGDWWAPLRTRTLRGAAAKALRQIGNAEALQVLRDAAAQGPRGVRAAASAELAQVKEAK